MPKYIPKPKNKQINITTPSMIILGGPQGAGKTKLIDYIMWDLQDVFSSGFGVVFTNTFFDGNPFPYINPKFVHPNFNEDVLIQMMDIQEGLVKKGIKKECFIIFDDCLEPEQFASDALKRLSTQLRHYHITCIMSTQYPNLLPPRFRSNAMHVAIFRTFTEISLKALHQSYGQSFETFHDFKNYVMHNTGNYKFIWFDNTESDPSEQYKIFKAPAKINKFKIKYNLTN